MAGRSADPAVRRQKLREVKKRKTYEGIYISYPPELSAEEIRDATTRTMKTALGDADADLILMMLGLRESPPTPPAAPRKRKSKVTQESDESDDDYGDPTL